MMKTCVYITLLSSLCASLAHAYPKDNYLFDRSGISYITSADSTPHFIKGGSVVPIDSSPRGNIKIDIPEAARENVVKVQVVGDKGGAALRRDGRLAVWGSPFSDFENSDVQGTYDPSASHTRTVTDVVDIATLKNADTIPESPTPLFMLMEDGTVRVFGPDGDLPIIPLHPDITEPVALFGNHFYVAVLDASGIARMVHNNDSIESAPDEDKLHALTDIASISGTCAIHTDGTVSSFDRDHYTEQQAFLDGLIDQTIVHADTESESILAVTANGELLTHNLHPYVRNIPPDLASNAKMVIFGDDRLCLGLDREGRAYLWGSNATSIDGAPGRSEIPKYLNSPVISVAFGHAHGIVVRTDGTVRGWGDDTHGQASGLNGVTNAIAVAADADYSLALLADGTVMGTGNDTHGQIAGLSAFTDVIDIAAGETHSLVLFRDGTVSGAGNDADGRINGLSHLQGVLDISAGFDHSVARYGDREIFCAGNNELGQCDIPTKVANANYVLDIAAGYRTSAAVIYTFADVTDNGPISSASYAGDSIVPQGIPGTLNLWGAEQGDRYKHTRYTGYSYYRSIELSDNSTITAGFAVRLSTHTAPNHPNDDAVDTSSDTDAYRGGFSGGYGSWASDLSLAEAECHMFAAGGIFHATIAANGRLRIFPDTNEFDSLSNAQLSVLNPPSSIYELASDDEVTLNSLLRASQPGPGIEIQTQVGDTYEIETTTNLTDTNSWTTLPAESNTRFYRLRKK